MVSRSSIDMLLNVDERLQRPNCNLNERVQGELEFMLQAQRNRRIIDHERDLNVYRSGSAPPTVEGSLKAVRSLFGNNNFTDFNDSVYTNGSVDNVALTEDDIRSHPAYLSYYYSHDNINPRLPPPLLSKEDWRVAQRFHAGGGSSFRGVADLRRKVIDDNNGSSLFSMQPGPLVGQAEQELMELRNAVRNNFARQGSVEWVDKGSDGLIGLQGSGLGTRRKSFADILQEGLDRPTLLGLQSRPSSVNTFGEYADPSCISELHPAALHNEVDSLEQQLHSGATLPGLTAVQDHNTTLSQSFSSAVGSSLSRSTTPDQHPIGRSPTPGLPPVGSRVGPIEKKNTGGGAATRNGHAPGINELGDVAGKLSGLSMSNFRAENVDGYGQTQVKMDLNNQPDLNFNIPGASNQSFHQHFIEKPNAENYSNSTNFVDIARNEVIANLNASKTNPNGRLCIPKRTSSSVNLLSNANAASIENFETLEVHQNANIPGSDFISHSSSAYPLNQSLVNSHLGAGGSGIGSNLLRVGNQGGLDLHPPMMDPHYAQYLRRTSNHRTCNTGSSSGPQIRNFFRTSSGELEGIDNSFIEALVAQQRQQYELSLLVKSGGSKEGYYKNPSPGFGMPYLRNSMPNSAGFRSFQNDQVAQLTSLMKSSLGGSIGSRHTDIGNNIEKKHVSSLLDEFKNNKARSFELSDIAGHVVEFSTDQYGSRFIQQKLETASLEEKNNIFPEIMPHARTLMTDVFGNYVIQKFFEHGTKSQRVELASQLNGHVLPLSLQMYGCRVIQKALEVVDVDLQKQMVAELDGSVMKCVRDQNGNHVIQKCIECVPEDQIQFIISSFYGQVVGLSMHPYGCRVIQRVLEYCRETNNQEVVMDEIMQAVCILAQDQYGNYVIQHVLEHGKPHIRSAVISKLAGQIVKMSQQKFASNVVERCLTFGGPEERQILVNEMLGSTDENEPLQAMMKDPFGNYVVQKVLETCDDQSLQLILSRIRVHFNTLKRYTYGKHIVSRVEKLIVAGERRIGLSSSLATSQAT